MKSFLVLFGVLVACSHHRADAPPRLLGPISELKARTDALGCKSIAPLGGLQGARKFSCEIEMGPCSCHLRVHVSTEERGEKSFVGYVLLQRLNCADNVGLAEVEQLLVPYVTEADHASLHEFLTQPRVERTVEERKDNGVLQDEMFGNVHVQTTFDADNATPSRDFSIDVIVSKPGAKLVKRAWHEAPCKDQGT